MKSQSERTIEKLLKEFSILSIPEMRKRSGMSESTLYRMANKMVDQGVLGRVRPGDMPGQQVTEYFLVDDPRIEPVNELPPTVEASGDGVFWAASEPESPKPVSEPGSPDDGTAHVMDMLAHTHFNAMHAGAIRMLAAVQGLILATDGTLEQRLKRAAFVTNEALEMLREM